MYVLKTNQKVNKKKNQIQRIISTEQVPYRSGTSPGIADFSIVHDVSIHIRHKECIQLINL